MSETLGDALARARRSLGRSVSDVEEATRIRSKMIDALESGDYDALPAPAYVRGYVISYAKYLDLDPAPLLKLFAEETGHETTRDAMRRLPSDEVVSSRAQNQTIPYRAVLLIVAAIAIVALAIWGVGQLLSGPEEPAPLPAVPEATSTVDPADETQTPAVVPTETVAPEVDTQTASVGEPFELRVEIAPGGASWLRITVDGLKAYEGILTGGETKEYDVTEEATVRIGKPSAVSIYRGDTLVPIPDGPETPEVRITSSDETP